MIDVPYIYIKSIDLVVSNLQNQMRKILKLISGILLLNIPLLSQVSDAPYSYVEQMPVFQGGTTAMYQFVYNNVSYPDSAMAHNIQGMVTAQFVVDIDSLAKEIKIVKGLGYGIDEEVLRLFELMNAQHLWIPGRHNNKPVPVIFSLPIKFKLEEKASDPKKNKPD
jgi:hypothetical protein